MAPGERLCGLGAHARLAARVCGARAGGVPSGRARAPRHRAHCALRALCALRAQRAHDAQRAHRARRRHTAPRAHQSTDTRQAGSHIAASAARRAAARRCVADPRARCRPSAGAPARRHRTRHERNHSDST